MALVTGNIVDWQGSPRPGLSPQIVFKPRTSAGQGNNVFFTNPIVVVPDAAGAFSVPLVDSFSTSPTGVYDVEIWWLNSAGVSVGLDQLTDSAHPLIVPVAGGKLGDLLPLPPSAVRVWVGEANNSDYGFWYQPSTALLRSNP
jgi:hypothetical protein